MRIGHSFDIRIHPYLGACAYICSEGTTLIESLEEYQGKPCLKLHFPTDVGIFRHQQLSQTSRLFLLH